MNAILGAFGAWVRISAFKLSLALGFAAIEGLVANPALALAVLVASAAIPLFIVDGVLNRHIASFPRRIALGDALEFFVLSGGVNWKGGACDDCNCQDDKL